MNENTIFQALDRYETLSYRKAFSSSESALFLVLIHYWNRAGRPQVFSLWNDQIRRLAGLKTDKTIQSARDRLVQRNVIFTCKNGGRGERDYSFNALFELLNPLQVIFTSNDTSKPTDEGLLVKNDSNGVSNTTSKGVSKGGSKGVTLHKEKNKEEVEEERERETNTISHDISDVGRPEYAPQLQQVLQTCSSLGIDHAAGEAFFNEFETVGWVNRYNQPMIKWQHALKSWGKRGKNKNNQQPQQQRPTNLGGRKPKNEIDLR